MKKQLLFAVCVFVASSTVHASYQRTAPAQKTIATYVQEIYKNAAVKRLPNAQLVSELVRFFGSNPGYSTQGVEMVAALNALPGGTDIASEVVIGLIRERNTWNDEQKLRFMEGLMARPPQPAPGPDGWKLNKKAQRVVQDETLNMNFGANR